MPEISVVIPMYNCEKYIIDCLSSLAAQSFKDFEVIVVNNCSTDASAALTEDFCKKDERFRLLYCAVGKTGSARNLGLDNARGRYVVFVDADDSVKEKYLEKMYDAIVKNDADIAVCGFLFHFLNTGKTTKGDCPADGICYDRDTALRELLRDKGFRFYMWNKMWKRSLFTDNSIRVSDMYYEDAVACPQLFCKARRVVTVGYRGYVYMRAFSKYKEIRMSRQRINDYINSIALMRLCMKKEHIRKSVSSMIGVHIFHVFFSLPMLINQAKGELKRGWFRNLISSWGRVISYSRGSEAELESYAEKEDAVF